VCGRSEAKRVSYVGLEYRLLCRPYKVVLWAEHVPVAAWHCHWHVCEPVAKGSAWQPAALPVALPAVQ